MKRDPFGFVLPTGALVRGDLWRAGGRGGDRAGGRDGDPPRAAIVVCHGFKGFKDWGFFPYLGETLARRTGLPTVTFNFTGSGIGEDPTTFTELEAFSRNTLTRELVDLEAVLDRLAVGRLGRVELPPVDRYGLLGHSRGGVTALLKTALRAQVRSLVTWAAVAHPERYEEAYAPDLDGQGVAYVENSRTGQQMPLRSNFVQDLRAHRDLLSPVDAAGSLGVPYLVVHGTRDLSVPPSDAEELAAAAPDATLAWIEDAGHTLEAGHPFGGPNPSLEEAVERSVEHFTAHLP